MSLARPYPTLLGVNSSLSIVDGEFLIERDYMESAGIEIGIRAHLLTLWSARSERSTDLPTMQARSLMQVSCKLMTIAIHFFYSTLTGERLAEGRCKL